MLQVGDYVRIVSTNLSWANRNTIGVVGVITEIFEKEGTTLTHGEYDDENYPMYVVGLSHSVGSYFEYDYTEKELELIKHEPKIKDEPS